MGLDLAAIDTRTVVKLPITDAGVEAAGLLKSQGVRVTLTGIWKALPFKAGCQACGAACT